MDKECQKQQKSEFVVSKIDCRALVELSFVDICIWRAHRTICKAFPGQKNMADSDWLRKFFKPVNIDFSFKGFTEVIRLHVWWVLI